MLTQKQAYMCIVQNWVFCTMHMYAWWTGWMFLLLEQMFWSKMNKLLLLFSFVIHICFTCLETVKQTIGLSLRNKRKADSLINSPLGTSAHPYSSNFNFNCFIKYTSLFNIPFDGIAVLLAWSNIITD